jgi:hypothetical protein
MSAISITKWKTVDGLLIVCGSAGEPRAAEWAALDHELETTKAQAVLVWSLGAVRLTSQQRAATAGIVRKRNLRIALITEESLMRRIVSAVGWFLRDLRAFDQKSFPEAVAYAGIPASRVAMLRSVVDDMQRDVEREIRAQQ